MAKENRGLRMLKIHFPVDLRCTRITGGQLFYGSLLVPDKKNTWKPEDGFCFEAAPSQGDPASWARQETVHEDHDVCVLWSSQPRNTALAS